MKTLIRCLAISLCFGAVGCSGATTSVSGKVTFKGQPVVYGTVLILGSDGLPKSGAIRPDGTFTVQDVAVGAAKVAVSSPRPPGSTPPAEKRPRVGRDSDETDDKVPLPSPASAPPEVIKNWVALPEKYGDPAKSDIATEVKNGVPLDIDLK